MKESILSKIIGKKNLFILIGEICVLIASFAGGYALSNKVGIERGAIGFCRLHDTGLIRFFDPKTGDEYTPEAEVVKKVGTMVMSNKF